MCDRSIFDLFLSAIVEDVTSSTGLDGVSDRGRFHSDCWHQLARVTRHKFQNISVISHHRQGPSIAESYIQYWDINIVHRISGSWIVARLARARSRRLVVVIYDRLGWRSVSYLGHRGIPALSLIPAMRLM